MGAAARVNGKIKESIVRPAVGSLRSVKARDVFVMRDENQRHRVLADVLGDQRHHLGGRRAVEVAGRFVRQQDLRPVDERTGDGHTLALPAAKLSRPVVQPRSQSDALEAGVGLPQTALAGVGQRRRSAAPRFAARSATGSD